MKVQINVVRMSTSSGLASKGDIVEMSEDEVRKIQTLRPTHITVLPEEAPKAAEKKDDKPKKRPTIGGKASKSFN